VRDELDQRVLQVARHGQGHPPVEDAEAAVLGAQQVARVRVAVQAARVEEHGEVGVDRDGAEARHVGRLVPVEPRPVHPLRHQHLARRELADDGRRGHRVEPAVLHRAHEVLGVLGLVDVVGLGDEAAAPLVHQRARQLDVLRVGLLALHEV
jgi:hypothetical protein